MSIVSTAEAVPNRLFAIYATLLAKSGGETPERLKAFMIPPALRGGQEGQSTVVYDRSLKEARAIGFVTERDDKLLLAEAAQPAPRQKEEDAFRDYLLSVLFDPERAEEAGQGNVAPALCWLLMQDPLRPIPWKDNPLPLIRRQLGGSDAFDLTNFSPLQSLAYWARHLGFVTIVTAKETLIIPDPFAAIERLLPAVFDSETQLRAAEFRRRLAVLCPVLEDGAIRARVEEQAVPELARPPQRLSRATSLALARLDARGRIVLEQLADAEATILDLGTAERRFSHVTIKGR